jgi:hypothetical protein
MTASASTSGTSPSTIFFAKPSAMAVLPTPASPTSSGLFLRRRHRICAVRSTSAARPISGSIRPWRATSLRLVAKLSSALEASFSSPRLFGFTLGLVLLILARHLGDAVGDVVDHVEPRHVLLVEQVDRLAVLLAEQGDQHVGAGDLLLAGGLHMEHRPLQHPLKAQRRLRLTRVPSAISGVVSSMKVAMSLRSLPPSAPQARRTFAAVGLSSRHSSRCSTVMYSCRFSRASLNAWFRVNSSSLLNMIRTLGGWIVEAWRCADQQA